MASQGDPTRSGGATPPAPPPARPTVERGIDLTTLFLSAVASAAAAYITSKIWAPGTLFSAAMSPVIVALVKEGLRKPTEVVANVVPASTRWSRSGAGDPGLVAEPMGHAAPPVDPGQPHVVLPPVVASETGPVRVYSTRARRLRWRLALITGLLGFGLCVVLFTVPELITGHSIGGSGHSTTFFSRRHAKRHRTTTTTGTTRTSTSTTPATKTDTTKTVTETQTVTVPTTTTPTTQAPPTTTTSATPTTPAPAASTTVP